MTFEFEAINRDLSIDLDIEVEGLHPRLDETTDERTLDIRQESFSVDFVCSEVDGRKTMSLEMGFCPSVTYRVNPDGTISIIIQSLAGEFVIDNIINSALLQLLMQASEARSLADAQLYANRLWQDAKEAQELIAEALLKEFTNTISPVAINTMQALFGSECLQYMFIVSEDDDTLKPHAVRIDYHRPEPEPGPEPNEGGNEDEPERINPELICPDGVIKHYTLGITEVRADLTVDSFMRWVITGPNSDPDDPTTQETRLELPDDDAAYYLYIKATKTVTPPNAGEESEGDTPAAVEEEGEEPPVGGVGTAEFIVSTQAKEWDSDENYYYFLYATIGKGGEDKDRAITYWNGFTEITPGRITAYKFVSPDGVQYIDFLTKNFRLGDAYSHLMFDHALGKLFLKGTITQSPAGVSFPTPCYRGVWIKNEEGEEPNQVAYYGDLFTYEGQSWLCIDESAVDEDNAVVDNPSEESSSWRIYAAKGTVGQTTFKSIVFTRSNTTPATPTGGTYESPIPTDKTSGGVLIWSDGVPSGEAQLWMSTRIFASDGLSPQQEYWTTPRAATDTADFDIEFSSVENPNPPVGHPNTNPQWGNASSESTIWMATSTKRNGVWGNWEVSKIKGEKGNVGQSAFKSIVFKRTNSAPSAPSGGSYSSPVPSGWSDGVPSGESQLWMSTRIFTSDGLSPQESEWTTPQPATDTADIDFEFSSVVSNPGNPTDNPSNWHNTATSYDIWMAVRKCKNGVWGNWEVCKIKGENGAAGKAGPMPRGLSEWNANGINGWYQGGDRAEDLYKDFVIYNEQHYVCIRSHQPTQPGGAIIYPTNTAYWSVANEFEFIAAKAMYVDMALIENATVKHLQTNTEAGKGAVHASTGDKTVLSVADQYGNPVLYASDNPISGGSSSSHNFNLSNTYADIPCYVRGLNVVMPLASLSNIPSRAYASIPQIVCTTSNWPSSLNGAIEWSLKIGATVVASGSSENHIITIPAIKVQLPEGSSSITLNLKWFGTPAQSSIRVACPGASASYSVSGSKNEFGTDGFQSKWGTEGVKVTSAGAKVISGNNEYAMVGVGALNGLSVAKKIVLCTAYPATEDPDTLYIKVS